MNFYGSPREFSELPDEYEDLNLGKVIVVVFFYIGGKAISFPDRFMEEPIKCSY